MGIQENKATTTAREHDFLSLYAAAAAKDPSPLHQQPQLHDSKQAPAPPSQAAALLLKTHDFLQPLEKQPGESPPPPDTRRRHQQPVVVVKQRALPLPLPGGIGAFSISPAPVVKAEPAFVLWGQPAVLAPQPEAAARGHQRWALPFAGAGQGWSRKGHGGFMDSGSRSSGGAGFDDDDGLAARREVSSSLKDLSVRVDQKGGSCSDGGTDQLPNTPKSKHSATEQRRRSKINDRFQILRELLPHTDQKRDKATFLLEVIEYIRFLQEKEQKQDTALPEWNQENAKILPWSNVYFRSFWKNAQSKGQIPVDTLPDPSLFMGNGSSPGFKVTGKSEDNHNTMLSTAASGAQDQAETDHMTTVSYKSAETRTNITNNITSQSQPKWTVPSPVNDCAVNSEISDEQLTIDEGTISVSSQYSQELLNSLTHALQSSGIDLTKASISVQINLGKRAINRPAAGVSSYSKELADPASNEIDHQMSMLGGGAEDHSHSTKRHKSGNSR